MVDIVKRIVQYTRPGNGWIGNSQLELPEIMLKIFTDGVQIYLNIV